MASPTNSIRGSTDATSGSRAAIAARALAASWRPNSSVVSSLPPTRPAVHDLQLADRADRPLLQPLEGLGDEPAGERERGEAERDDAAHQQRPPLLADEICARRAREELIGN